MTRGKSVGAVLVAVILTALTVSGVALAASVSPITHSGNTPGGCDLKIENPRSGVYAIPNQAGKKVRITVSSHRGGEQLAFDSDLPVLKVYMKGGPSYNEYNYGANGTMADSGLVCPSNLGGNVPDISHVCFYFGQGATTTTTAGTTTTTAGTTTTTASTTTTTTAGATTTTTAGSPSTSDTLVGGETQETTPTSEAGDPGSGDEGSDADEPSDDQEQGDDSPSTSDTLVGGEAQETTPTSGADVGGTPQNLTTVREIQTGVADLGGPGAGIWALGLLALALAGGLGWTAVRPAVSKK